MLISLDHDPKHISTFRALYSHICELLTAHKKNGPPTVIFGRMAAGNGLSVEQYVAQLRRAAECLSTEGWVVLDITSCQPTVDRLIQEHNICGYPHPVLDDFTLPLIRSRALHTVHFMKNYRERPSALREHNEAQSACIPIKYI